MHFDRTTSLFFKAIIICLLIILVSIRKKKHTHTQKAFEAIRGCQFLRRLHYWLNIIVVLEPMPWRVAFSYLFNLPFFDSKNKRWFKVSRCFYHSLLWVSCAIQMIKKKLMSLYKWSYCLSFDALWLFLCVGIAGWIEHVRKRDKIGFVRCDHGIFDNPNKCIE